MSHVLLAGRGLVLRPLKVPDAAEIFALVDANREHLRRWLPWVDATVAVADTRRFLRAATASAHSITPSTPP